MLVVDDNEDAAESLATLLRLFGHELATAHSGAAALEVAQGFYPQVVFLDIGMPGMNGYEVVRRIRADSTLCDTMLVALTDWGAEEDRRLTLEAGFDHHITKPIDAGQVRTILAAAGKEYLQ